MVLFLLERRTFRLLLRNFDTMSSDDEKKDNNADPVDNDAFSETPTAGLDGEKIKRNVKAKKARKNRKSNDKSPPKRINVCRNFLNDNCRFGGKCHFAHEGASVANDKSKTKSKTTSQGSRGRGRGRGRGPPQRPRVEETNFTDEFRIRVEKAFQAILKKGCTPMGTLSRGVVIHGQKGRKWDQRFWVKLLPDGSIQLGPSVRGKNGIISWCIFTTEDGVEILVLIHSYGTSVFVPVPTKERETLILEFTNDEELKPFDTEDGWVSAEKADAEKAAADQAAVVKEAVKEALAKKDADNKVRRNGKWTGAPHFVPGGHETEILRTQITLHQQGQFQH